ncbi:bile acid:sodium symporter family protein [Neobacillus dielmonensis]|uniref:bile acid:sodium symporter family protein n=1 Tax=Neobacillus dielmonensis TaxID=1347369 RepID=UPI0005A757D3|nr:bile acid:sodium symporter family protein [Neobacillus dielmonensis]
MLQKLNKFLEKIMPALTPVSVVMGVLLSAYLKDFSYLIPWIFAFMTFAGSLGSNFKSIKDVVSHPFPIFMAMLILHVFMPIWAWGVGHVAFPGDIYTITGLILVMVIPTGITSFIWVSIYKGNIPMVLSIILIDTLLSPVIVPFSISLFVGQTIVMDYLDLMKGLLLMVVIPSILAMLLNQLTKGKIHQQWGPRLAPFSKLGVGIVVMLNGAIVSPYLKDFNLKLLGIMVVVFLIAMTGYIFSFLIGRIVIKDWDNLVTVTFSAGMRNISAGAVIGVTYFPASVAVPVVIGMLFQQTLASLSGHFLAWYHHKKSTQGSVAA